MLRLRLTISKGLFLAVGIFSAAIGAYGTNLIQDANSTKDWPTVQGKIVTAEVRPGGTEGKSRPAVRFQYSLRGSIYRSEQYRRNVAGQLMNTAAAEALVKKYPVGTQVLVHYEPENPSNAIIEQDDPTLGYLVCSAAVVMMGAVAIWTIGQRKRANRK